MVTRLPRTRGATASTIRSLRTPLSNLDALEADWNLTKFRLRTNLPFYFSHRALSSITSSAPAGQPLFVLQSVDGPRNGSAINHSHFDL